jgi:hypothetical protein
MPPAPPPEGPKDDRDGQQDLAPVDRERHLEDALREIDVAERAIEKSIEDKKKKPETPQTPGEQAGTGACDTACRALGSMEKSAVYVCRLAGPGDPRCRNAQDRVKSARNKVERAACSCPVPVALHQGASCPVKTSLDDEESLDERYEARVVAGIGVPGLGLLGLRRQQTR